MTRIPGARHFAQLRSIIAPALLVTVIGLAMFACTEGRDLTSAGGDTHAVRLALVPHYHLFGSSSSSAPINLAHLTVVKASTHDTIAGPFTVALDPSSSQWQLPVEFNVPDDATDNSIVVIVELLNLTNGVASVQWSGETAPITIAPGVTTPPPAPIELVQGPADNLSVIAVTIVPVTGRTLEGDAVAMHAAVVGSGTPQLFWTSLNPTLATVGDDGVVHTLLPGSARIVANAGVKADTETVVILQRPVSVSVTPSPVSFSSIGQTINVTGRVLDARGAVIAADSVLYTVVDPSIAQQPTRGSFKAAAAGSTTANATAASTPAIHTTVALDVVPVVASISLSDNAIELRSIGETRRVTGVARDAGGTAVAGAVIQFSSENGAVATVATDGTITARGAGSTGIVATSGSASARVAVSVNQLTTAVSVAPATTLLESINATSGLTATARDAGGATMSGVVFGWSSSAPAIASVDANGIVTAHANGNATITASAPGGASGTASVTVTLKVASIVPTPTTLTLQSVGATANISADPRDATGHSLPVTSAGLTWSSSAAAVATVDQAGTVTAVANGNAVITIRSASGASTTVAVTVHQQAQSVTVSSSRDTLHASGETAQMTGIARDAGGAVIPGATIAWTSSNPAVASVDVAGVVRAVAPGVTTITGTADAVHGSATIVVKFAVTSVQVSRNIALLKARGDAAEFSAVARDAAGNIVDGITFSWSSSNEAVVTVNESTGATTAVDDGTANVLATAPNGVAGQASIQVLRRTKQVTLSPDTATIAHGDSRQFTATLKDANGFVTTARPVTWQSDNPSVATVSLTGLVTVVSDAGTAIITATSDDGAATATVHARAQITSAGLSIVPGFNISSAANCIPFGTNTEFGFTGFMYRNVPAFHMNAGDRIAFDLGALNGADLRRNIFFSPLNINPGPGGNGSDVVPQGVHATEWTKVVSETYVPQNPRGNNIIGDYELIYTAEASYDFPGGGFAVGFQGAPPATFADGGCEQVLVGTTANDPSNLFYARFFSKSDLTLGQLDNPGGGTASAIGGIKIYSVVEAGLTTHGAGAAGQGVRILVPAGPPLPKPAGPVVGDGHDIVLPAKKKAGSGGN